MGPLSTLTVAWAAVYAYVAFYYGTLWALRRSDREYLYFALLLAALSAHSLADARLVTETEADAARAMLRVSQIAIAVMGAYFVDFCHALVERPVRARRFVYGLAATGILLIAAGLYTAPTPLGGSSGSGVVPGLVQLTLLGKLHLVVTFGAACWALARTWSAQRGDAGSQLVLLSLGVGLACTLHDTMIRIGLIHGAYLLEHTSMLTVGAMSYALLARFMRAGQDLTTRTLELEASTQDLRVTQELLVTKEQLAAVGELSAVIAHEVRNPLAVIKNAVSGLRRPTLKADDRRTLLDILDEETDRLNRLMHDLLAYARPVTPKSEDVSVEELVQRAVDRARHGAAPAELVDFDLDLRRGPAKLRGDADLLRHALANVIDNALLAMPEGGTLSIRAVRSEIDGRAAIALIFEDEGEGMDTLVRDKATAPFFTTRPAGTGLGLAIVERVVRNHGGRVEIESSHGAGTAVTIRLPLERPSLLPPPRGEERDSNLSAIHGVRS
ncbi:MAG: hypothetical protein GXP55_16190 [Deltaproteobacteria bacterium]|nr:hypothetical protein [Deltaproteobacteria bacterium]